MTSTKGQLLVLASFDYSLAASLPLIVTSGQVHVYEFVALVPSTPRATQARWTKLKLSPVMSSIFMLFHAPVVSAAQPILQSWPVRSTTPPVYTSVYFRRFSQYFWRRARVHSQFSVALTVGQVGRDDWAQRRACISMLELQ